MLDVRNTLVMLTLLALAALATGCGKSQGERELRGTATISKDGKTYLSVDDDCGSPSTPIFLDGERWPHALHVAGPVSPGQHDLACGSPGSGIRFEVKPSTTFRFNYWGP